MARTKEVCFSEEWASEFFFCQSTGIAIASYTYLFVVIIVSDCFPLLSFGVSGCYRHWSFLEAIAVCWFAMSRGALAASREAWWR